MMQRRRAVLVVLLVLALPVAALGWDLRWTGSAAADRVAMTWVNALVDEYGTDYRESLAPLHLGLGLDVGATVTDLRVAGFSPRVAIAADLASRATDGGSFSASAFGLWIGLTRAIGRFDVGIDLGEFRGSLTQPRSETESAWGWGVRGEAVFRVLATKRFDVTLGLRARYLAIGASPTSGGRNGEGAEPLLDFSGVGLRLGFTWKGW